MDPTIPVHEPYVCFKILDELLYGTESKNPENLERDFALLDGYGMRFGKETKIKFITLQVPSTGVCVCVRCNSANRTVHVRQLS